MKIKGSMIAGAALLLLSLPVLAASMDRDSRGMSREAGYRAGFDDGYRQGLFNGERDARMHMRYDYHGRDHFIDNGRFRYEFRHEGDYKKGFKEGFHQGYRNGYDRFAFPHRRRW